MDPSNKKYKKGGPYTLLQSRDGAAELFNNGNSNTGIAGRVTSIDGKPKCPKSTNPGQKKPDE